MNELISSEEAASLLKMSKVTLLKNYVPRMVDGVHFFRPNPRVIKFYRDRILNWYENINDPIAHAKWLESNAK